MNSRTVGERNVKSPIVAVVVGERGSRVVRGPKVAGGCENKEEALLLNQKLTERVPSADERHGLSVVHSHSREYFADILGAEDGVRDPARPLGVHWKVKVDNIREEETAKGVSCVGR